MVIHLITSLVQRFEIADVGIQEAEIAAIIRKIYEGGMARLVVQGS